MADSPSLDPHPPTKIIVPQSSHVFGNWKALGTSEETSLLWKYLHSKREQVFFDFLAFCFSSRSFVSWKPSSRSFLPCSSRSPNVRDCRLATY